MIEQIIALFSGVWDFIWEERVWTIPSILVVIFGIPAYIKFRKNKNGKNIVHMHKEISGVSTSQDGKGNVQKITVTGGMSPETEKHQNEYIEYLKKRNDLNEEQVNKLSKEREKNFYKGWKNLPKKIHGNSPLPMLLKKIASMMLLSL